MTTPSQPMLARRQLRQAVLASIQGISATPAITVESPGDWSTPPAKLPAVLVRVARERKESVAKTMPEFTTTATIEIEARVAASTGESAQDAIENLCYLIENAILTNYDVMGLIQQVASIDSELEISSEGKQHFGGAKMQIAFEMFEAFDPVDIAGVGIPLTSIGLHADLVNVYDPNGTYTISLDAPPYTPLPAPRTSGPDGRDEAALDIILPQ